MPGLVLRRLLPRHAKAYLWICFLVLVFGSMILSDNGVSLYNILITPWTRKNDSSYSSHLNLTEEVAQVESKMRLDSTDKFDSPQEEPSLGLLNHEKILFGDGPTSFTPDDVVILFKTGATSLWRRVPIHLATTLANSSLTPNVALYSDSADQIVDRPIIDVLANVSSSLKAHADFELYHKTKEASLSNLYLEAAAMDGDFYLPGGWRLDKYKFLPLAAHAAANYPRKKWYIYMEDDNYYFWNSLFAWLGTFDPATPLLLGSPAARLGEDFAHGGSGFAISGAAMDITFGRHADLAAKWEDYAQERCCGDQVLSHVMAELGVTRDRRYDHTEWAGLQALPTWRMGFGSWNWCSPLFNVHKTHQSDVSRLHIFEKKFQQERGERAVLRYRDLFRTMILPTMNGTQSEWDNEANEKWFASTEKDAETLTAAERKSKAWYSAEACSKACEEWDECLSWKYADDACGMSSTTAQGRRIDAGIRMESGWMLGRIKKLAGRDCEALPY